MLETISKMTLMYRNSYTPDLMSKNPAAKMLKSRDLVKYVERNSNTVYYSSINHLSKKVTEKEHLNSVSNNIKIH